MFQPSRDQVRQFFIDVWKKSRRQEMLSPIETMALEWIHQHPEYFDLLENPDAMQMDFSVERQESNPFLHLSMHLAIAEQLSIDHPRGIKQAFEQLCSRMDVHDAYHELIECLGQVIWEAQRLGKTLDSDVYLDLIRRRVTKD